MNLFSSQKQIAGWLILTASFTCLQSSTTKFSQTAMYYPNLKAIPVTDTYFGQVVEDKYRLLENQKDSTVQKWIKEEKRLCDSILQKISSKDILRNELEEVMYSSNVQGGFPRTAGSKVFFFRSYLKEKTQRLYCKDSIMGKEIEIFSTDSINKENENFNIDYFEPSFDGKYLAFGLSSNGGEKSVMKIMNMETKALLPESIERTTYGTPFWVPGKNAFFYNQLKEIKYDGDKNAIYEDSKVKLHWLNTDPKDDKEIFSRELNKDLTLEKIDFPMTYIFPGSDRVITLVFHGTSSYLSLYSAPLDDLTSKSEIKPAIWKKICSANEKVKNFTLNNHQLFLISFKDNSNGTLKKYDLDGNFSDAITLMEGKEEVIDDILQTNNSLYIKKLKNGICTLTKMNLGTGIMNNVELPFSGSVTLKPAFGTVPNHLNSNDLFFSMESWDREVAVYYYNSTSKKTIKTDLRPQGKYGNPTDLIVKEIEVPSHDGALVPLSIIYSKNSKLDGTNPTLLTGYGAYGFSINNSFNLQSLVWIRLGGIYAIAHVRGGGEKGDSWYKGGFKSTKPNSWKDFIACAEYLIKNKYTSSEKLAAKGTSAGGITIGRAITERPDIFKAAILNVAALNTLRLEKSGNTLNVSEFGSTADASEYKYLAEMDVYHHIKEGVKYPSILITAGLNDARVDWWQPAKAVARFQEVSAGKSNVVLFSISDYGHSGNVDKIKGIVDDYSFLFWQLKHPKFNLN
jgi:prolyl oligopeptidase